MIGFIVLLLGVVGCANCKIYHPNDLMDEIISEVSPYLADSILVEDFTFRSPCGSELSCFGGNASSLASLKRRGYTRLNQQRYYSTVWDLRATLIFGRLAFSFDQCILSSNGNETSFQLSGPALHSNVTIQLTITESTNCTGVFTNFELNDIEVHITPGRGADLLNEKRLLSNVTDVIKRDIIDSVNFNLYESSGTKFNSLKNCK